MPACEVKLKHEFKMLLQQHSLPSQPTSANIEKFSEACAVIVDREKAKHVIHSHDIGRQNFDHFLEPRKNRD